MNQEICTTVATMVAGKIGAVQPTGDDIWEAPKYLGAAELFPSPEIVLAMALMDFIAS
jgi:hypothetical protein